MNNKRVEKLEKSLDSLYENLKLIRRETITRLGNKDALHIIDFHVNNWIDISKWIYSEYSVEEQKIVYFQFFRLLKEIYWLQLLFFMGNYPVSYRNLRYILELISQAYYINQEYPDLTLDEQIGKIKGIEEKIYGLNIVQSTLCKILPNEYIQTEIKSLWIYLNKHAHPSALQMDRVATEDFSSLLIDSFNENLARDVLKTTNEIFDLVYSIIFKNFPKIKELALKYEFIDEWEEFLPNTVGIIKE